MITKQEIEAALESRGELGCPESSFITRALRELLERHEDSERLINAGTLAVAWKRYTDLFGEPPHGTEKQMGALLALIPDAARKTAGE